MGASPGARVWGIVAIKRMVMSLLTEPGFKSFVTQWFSLVLSTTNVGLLPFGGLAAISNPVSSPR